MSRPRLKKHYWPPSPAPRGKFPPCPTCSDHEHSGQHEKSCPLRSTTATRSDDE